MKNLLLLGVTVILGSQVSADMIRFTPAETAMIRSHGPWPPEPKQDPSNRFSGDVDAMRFGRSLFFDERLSQDGSLSCASCHQPDRAMADGLPRSRSRVVLDRNSPGIGNLAGRRWYGWDGRSDTLWDQSIRPIVNPLEFGLGPEVLARRIIFNPDLAASYRELVGRAPSAESPESILVHVGKFLSAWMETLITPRTSFDSFRDALERGEELPVEVFSQSARRGLKLFVGEGRCSFCHVGPLFSNDEFHHVGILHFVDGNRVDSGRHGGLDRYSQSRYTRTGPYSDESPESASRSPGQFVRRTPDDWGRFKVPSLRNVSSTAPYMHDGSLSDLTAVVEHYNEMDMKRLHVKGESLLRPLGLDETQIADLVNFLKSLEGDPVTPYP